MRLETVKQHWPTLKLHGVTAWMECGMQERLFGEWPWRTGQSSARSLGLAEGFADEQQSEICTRIALSVKDGRGGVRVETG